MKLFFSGIKSENIRTTILFLGIIFFFSCSDSIKYKDCTIVHKEILDSLKKGLPNEKVELTQVDFCRGYDEAKTDSLTYLFSGAVYPYCVVLDIESKGIKVKFENEKYNDERLRSYNLGYKYVMFKRLYEKYGAGFGVVYNPTDTSCCIDEVKLNTQFNTLLQIKKVNETIYLVKLDSIMWPYRKFSQNLIGIYGNEEFPFEMLYSGIKVTTKEENAIKSDKGDPEHVISFDLSNFNHPKFVNPAQGVLLFTLKEKKK